MYFRLKTLDVQSYITVLRTYVVDGVSKNLKMCYAKWKVVYICILNIYRYNGKP